jgi:hypothetical protein
MPIEQHRRKDIFGDVSNGNIVVGGVGDGRSWPFGQVLTLLGPLIGDMHVHHLCLQMHRFTGLFLFIGRSQ